MKSLARSRFPVPSQNSSGGRERSAFRFRRYSSPDTPTCRSASERSPPAFFRICQRQNLRQCLWANDLPARVSLLISRNLHLWSQVSCARKKAYCLQRRTWQNDWVPKQVLPRKRCCGGFGRSGSASVDTLSPADVCGAFSLLVVTAPAAIFRVSSPKMRG